MLFNNDSPEQTGNGTGPNPSQASLNVVVGWELNIDNLEFTTDQQHRDLLASMGEASPAETYPLMNYVSAFVIDEDAAVVYDRLAYAKANRDNPDYTDRFELRMKSPDGRVNYFLINTWLLRPGIFRGQGQNITDLKIIRHKLEVSSATISSLLECTGDYIFICRTDTSILSWNSRFSKLMADQFGVELTPKLQLVAVVPEHIYEQWKPYVSGASEGMRSTFEMDIQLADFHHIEVSVNPVMEGIHVAAIAFFIRDVTDRWRMHIWDGLETRVLEQAFRNEPFAGVLDSLLLGIQRIIPDMNGYIMRKIDGKMSLEWISAPSLPPSYLARLPEIPIDPRSGSCGLSASTMQPAFINDVREHSAWDLYRDYVILAGFYSCYSLPVISREGKVLGTLGAYFRKPHQASDFEMSIWYRAVNLVGILLERDANEREVHRKNNQLDRIAASIPGALYMIRREPGGNRYFEYLSNKVSSVIGHAVESHNLDYDSIVSLIREEYQTELKKEVSRSIREKTDVSFEFKLRTDVYPKDHTFQLLSSHVYNNDGTISTYGTIFDITRQKKTEERLRVKNEEMELLLRSMDDLVFVLDSEHRFSDLFTNDEARAAYPRTQFIGESVFDCLPASITDGYRKALDNILSGLDAAEFFCEWSTDGRRQLYRARVRSVPDRSRFLITMKDVTSEQLAIDNNMKLQRVLEEAGEHSRFGIFEFDVASERLYWSPQLRKLTGIPDALDDSMLYDYYRNMIHPDDRTRLFACIEEAVQHNRDFEVEHRLRHEEGHYIWLHSRADCMTDTATGKSFIRGLAMEITLRKKAEEDAKRRQNLLEAVSLLSMKLMTDGELETTIYRLLQQLGETIGVSRISLFRNEGRYSQGPLRTNGMMCWAASGIPAAVQDAAFYRMALHQAGLFNGVDQLQQGLPVMQTSSALPEPEQQIWAECGTKSMLVLPVMLSGEWWGALCLEQCEQEMEWPEDEVIIFHAVANLMGSVVQQKEVREDLMHREAHYRSVLDTMAEGMVIINVNGEVVSVNPAAECVLRMPKEELLKARSADFITLAIRPDGVRYKPEECPSVRSMESRQAVNNEILGVLIDGMPDLWLSVNAGPLMDPVSGEVIGAVETFTDITERLRQETELKNNLQQKEILLTEIHHRVKNNLAIVSSLLQLQQLYTKDEHIRAMLTESQGRLRSMSLVHEILYRNGDFSKISFDSYLKEIGDYLKSTYAKPEQEVLFETTTDHCELEITKAIPCGLIVNELITNAFKYAFVNRKEGLIVISLRQNGDYYVLEICDDGPGFPAGFNWTEAKTMGFTLVRTLSTQLKGALSVENKNGARLVLTFPG